MKVLFIGEEPEHTKLPKVFGFVQKVVLIRLQFSQVLLDRNYPLLIMYDFYPMFSCTTHLLMCSTVMTLINLLGLQHSLCDLYEAHVLRMFLSLGNG